MSAWTEQLDEALVLATSKGRYHVILFYLLCMLAAIPTAFLTFSQVFISATPDHWCRAPPLLQALNISEQNLKDLIVPYHMKPDGSKVYEQCLMYDLNMSAPVLEYPKTLNGTTDGLTLDGDLKMVLIQEMIRAKDLVSLVDTIVKLKSHPVPCRFGWTYDKEYYDRTYVTDMDLVCDRSWWPRTSNTLFWVGSIFGNILFGWISDRFGRRPAILAMIAVEVPLTIALSFTRDYTLYTCLRVLAGFFFPALYQIPFILSSELMPPSRRTHTGMVVGMMFATGMCLLSLLAYAVRDWYALSLVISVPFVLLYSYFWLIPESPRWLVSRGRVADAERVLRKMARANGIKLEHGFLLKLHEQSKTLPLPPPVLRAESCIDKVLEVPRILVNGHAIYPEEEAKPPLLHCADRRISNMKTFKCDLNHEPNVNETDPRDNSKHNDLEGMLAEKVVDIINRKSESKLDDEHTNDKNVSDGVEDIDTVNGDKDTIKSEASLGRRKQQKSTQTDTLDKYKNIEFRRKSYQLMNRFLGKEDLDDFTMKVKCVDDEERRMDEEYSEGEPDVSVIDIFRNPNIRKKFLILTYDWIANGVVYNSLSYNAPNLGVNDYLAFFIGGVVEIPSYFIAWKLMDHYGRRWVLCVTMAVGGLACLSCIFVPDDVVWVTITLVMVSKFCVASSFAVFYVFVVELLPTVLRSQAIATSSFISCMALLACPYIVHLAVYSKVLPLILMGFLSLTAAAASLFLPETLHAPLPQTVREGEDFGKDFAIWSCPTRRTVSCNAESH